GSADAARQLRVVELLYVGRRWLVIPALADVGQRVAHAFSPHADVEHDDRGGPAPWRGLGLARSIDELLLCPSLRFQRRANQCRARQDSWPLSGWPCVWLVRSGH